MTTNVGCIVVLLGTMGIVTGAAVNEGNVSLTEKRGLPPYFPPVRARNCPHAPSIS